MSETTSEMTSNGMNTHLSSEELELALAGKPAGKTLQHLQTCTRCTAELVNMQELLGAFREQATTTAAFYRTTPMAARPVHSGARPARWAMAFAAAVLVLGGAVSPLVLRHPAAMPVAIAAPGTGDAPSDDALLSSVQNDLSTSVPAPLLPLASTSTSSTSLNDNQISSNK